MPSKRFYFVCKCGALCKKKNLQETDIRSFIDYVKSRQVCSAYGRKRKTLSYKRRVVASHFLSQGLCFAGAHLIEACPKARAVVHLDEVRQFVLQDVVLQVSRQEHKIEREVDAAP